MQIYQAPIRDMKFVLDELWQDDGFGELPALAEFTPDLTGAILEEAGKFSAEVLLPVNRVGDEEGCTLENGVVRTPAGFKEAYEQFTQGGWNALAAAPEWGGQGVPERVNKLVEEMTCSTNLSFGLYPGLTHGANMAIEAHATNDLKNTYLAKMVSGEWSGTMCLTEAHCGTDLGLLRTRAEPQEDGSYKVSGTKIFISAGEHDLTGNIIHLVLARLPDAPEGTKGISMFLVPKFLPRDDGSPGERNAVRCSSIEHKMGLNGSPTCEMQFEEATGWLVGQPNKGMAAMFTMMNAERLSVGIQGLGVGEIAYQSAAYYAKERLQGRSLAGAREPDKPADPIIVHPDVRRMLMTMRAYNEGCRALGAWVARALDAEKHAGEPEARRRAGELVALMTPIVKALFTDLGQESANLAVQVHGGHGYVRETGVEQFVRDGRIAMIYEGANGIQALDLVGRKLGTHAGRYLRSFFHPVSNFIEENKGEGPMKPMIEGLERAFGALQRSTATIAQRGLSDPEEAGAAAADYLRMFGLVAIAYCFARATKVAGMKLMSGNGEAEFYAAKITTATFYFERILPQVSALFLSIKAGKRSMMALEEEAF